GGHALTRLGEPRTPIPTVAPSAAATFSLVTMELRMRPFGFLLFFLALAALPAPAAEVDALLARIKAAGREGAGNAEAGKAWRELAQRGPEALLPALTAFDGAAPAAANWLRTAADTLAERALAAGQALPADKLEAFVKDTRHAGTGRRVAYE